MTRLLAVLAPLAIGLALCPTGIAGEKKAEVTEPMLVHSVYFSLKDNSPAEKQKLVDACKKYLSHHPGTVAFAAGTRAEEMKRPVNDVDFDVALHIVFKDKASHDKYAEAELHKKFIEENKDNWKKVRVFDAWVMHEGKQK
jgi:hypothetical protein